MNRRMAIKLFMVGLIALVFISIATAFAANLEVEDSNIGQVSRGVTANQIKPLECAQNLTNIVSGSGIIHGTEGNDLILGSSGDDEIYGYGGDDCILAGAGDNIIYGGDGNDVCFGGSGTNTFFECETTFP